MTTARRIRKALRDHGEIQREELPWHVYGDEAGDEAYVKVRDALEELGDEVNISDADWVSLSEQPTRSPTGKRQPRGYKPGSLRREAEQRARQARELPAVIAFREATLGGKLVEDPAAWIERRESDPPTPAEFSSTFAGARNTS